MIVLLVSGDFTTSGGMDRANYELARYLAHEVGVKVQLVAYRVAPELASHRNVLWQRVPKPFNSYALGSSLLSRYGKAAAAAVRQQVVYTVVNGGNCVWPDINWVHAVQQSWERRIAHARWHVRLRQRMSRTSAMRAERRALQVARVIVANSEQTRSRLIADLGIAPEKIYTIYFGTDAETFHPATLAEKTAARERFGLPSGTLTAAFVGTLGYDRNKGFDILFEAWRQLCADPAWDVNLLAAGGGAEVPYWQSQAEQAGLSARIRMLGFTKDIAELLRAADVLVHPAFYEAYGIAVHEALCCGIPVLVTRSAGIAERYPEDLCDLLLDTPPSVEGLVVRLRRWRVDREAWQLRMQGFSSQLRQRTWRDMARDFVEQTMPALAGYSAGSLRSRQAGLPQ